MLRPLLLATALISPVLAEVRLPKVFTDGEVLQRDRPVPVWGWADAGKKVTVKFAGQEKSAVAATDGRWRVDLAALPASAESRTMEVSEEGGPPVIVKDILVGEVWLASGQSNMEFKINQTRPEDLAIANAGLVPLLRLFQVPKKLSATRLDEVEGNWQPATPESSQDFSAVGYFFGKRIAEELHVPVGIIHSSWGGSRIEPWFADEGLEGIPDLEELKNHRAERIPGNPAYLAATQRHLSITRAWLDQADAALKASQPVPEQPAIPQILPIGPGGEIGLYQAMVHPLVPYGLRGFLWYQGESNVGEGMLYELKMEALIKGWRQQFAVPNAPFLFVQIAPYNYGDRGAQVPELWTAQQDALKIPHTGMAVTMDIGNPGDIHPKNKSDVGYRLARWALADTYGKTAVVKTGPLYKSFEIAGDAIRIRFDGVGSGLSTRDGQAPNHFEIAGEDGVFHPAQAAIAGSEVVLKSADVPQPKMARYAWSQVAEPNLCNKDGLPAASFNTHWPLDPELGRNVALGKSYTSSNANTHNWNSGLTDGNWAGANGTCYATGEAPEFPKDVIIDLGRSRQLQAVRFGVPNFGSTKTIAISVSDDGKTFQDVGSHEFPANKETRSELRFDKRPARYVRATFVDHYPQQYGYPETFGFLTEVEAYEAVK
jgi:sialate O-acetylesterase